MHAGLYVGDPHVLHVKDFTEIRQRTAFYAVEFYAGWCGHCQAFAKTWSAVASTACSASPALRVGAVDCVADHMLCKHMGVVGFPTLRLFGPGITSSTGLDLNKRWGGRTPRTSRDVVEGILLELHGVAKAGLLGGDATARSLAAMIPQNHMVLMVASAQAKCNELDHRHAGWAAGGRGPPTLGPPPAAAPGAAPGAAPRTGSRLRPGEAPAELRQLPLPLEDMTSAVVYGLQREIYKAPFAGEEAARKRQALHAWLATLARAMPGAGNRAAMRALLVATRKRRPNTPQEWESLLQGLGEREALLSQLDEGGGAGQPLLPDGAAEGGIAWRACAGHSAEARGYPCGMWMLFHTLLAHSTDADAAASLAAIAGYVRHFFGCEDCAAHFAEMVRGRVDPMPTSATGSAAGSARSARPSANEAALWLWRAHNRASLRINASGVAAVLELGLRKVEWPAAADCPSCRGAAGRWRDGPLLEFLRRSYCHAELDAARATACTIGLGAPARAAAAAPSAEPQLEDDSSLQGGAYGAGGGWLSTRSLLGLGLLGCAAALWRVYSRRRARRARDLAGGRRLFEELSSSEE